MEDISAPNPYIRTKLTTNRQEKVQQRRAAFECIKNFLDTRDTATIPRCYGGTSQEELYEEGLKAGRATFEDGLKYNHDFFLETTSRGTISNAR